MVKAKKKRDTYNPDTDTGYSSQSNTHWYKGTASNKPFTDKQKTKIRIDLKKGKAISKKILKKKK